MSQTLLPFDQAHFGLSVPETVAVFDPDKFHRDDSPSALDASLSVLDACRIKLSHVYDKLSSLSNSRTRLLPHQIEATHIIASALRPRFIIADEVGLGKTIEAGLVIKELLFRKGYKKVLIAVPAPLTVQWQQEMKSKFNEDFTIINRKNFHSFQSHSRVLTSIDFIKNPSCADRILNEKWDIVVFDEAHRLRRDYSKITHAYAFAEKISKQCEALLLLSATPFRGKLEELFYLVQLIDPHLLGPHSSFVNEHIAKSDGDRSSVDLRAKIQKIMVRRRKVEVGGFTRRFATTVRLELSPGERAFYDETTEYVRREYNLAMETRNRAVGFVMIVFQKLLDSSTRALLRALEKRKLMLETRMHSPVFLSEISPEEDEEFLECENPEDRQEAAQAGKKTLKDLRKEILTLNHLIQVGRSIREDRKLTKLKESIFRLKKDGHTKFVIFTQFRTTQDYLAESIQEFSVTLFHGSLSLKQKEDAISEFKERTEILICTEAGGEGRNLQFASILFNYDLPWSPLKIEQRIGRIHRFGQVRDVHIFNFATRDTVAERVLEVLEEKIRLFEESIGPSDALLGAVEDEVDFENLLMQFVAGKKSKEELDVELSDRLRIAESGYRKLNDLVTPQCLDFNLNDYYNYTQENRKIDNGEIEKITLTYLESVQDPDYALYADRPPGGPSVYSLLERKTGVRIQATFDSEKALENDRLEFLAVGHPLVDRALEFFLSHPWRKSIRTYRSSEKMIPGWYFVYMCRMGNGMNRVELISCLVPENDASSAEVPGEILIPPGVRSSDLPPAGLLSYERSDLLEAQKIARLRVQKKKKIQAVALREKLHSVFKKEEYKIEISFGKKIRSLEEKREIHRMRYRMKPTTENRALLTRTENELLRARADLQFQLGKIRQESVIEIRLDLMQIYRILN